jgi:RND family efflux transporter MFP subunit
VERGDLYRVVTSSGNFVTQHEAKLSLEIAGKIAEVFCKEGDQVKSGAVLAKIETNALELALAQAQLAKIQAQVAQFEANLAKMQSQDAETQVEINLARAESDLLQTEAGIFLAEATERRARIDMDVAEDAMEQAEDLLDRVQKFLPSSHSKVKDAKSAYENVVLQLEAAQAQLEAARVQLVAADSQFESAQRQYAAIGLQLNIAATQTESADLQRELTQAQLEVSELALAEAQNQIDEATIVAPFNGVIAGVSVDEGDTIPAGMTIIHLVDLSRLELIVEVDEIDVFQVTHGQDVTVTLDSMQDEVLAGKVTSVYPTPTKVTGLVMYSVSIELDAPADPGLRIGMRATADIVVEKKTNVIKVPSLAIKEDGQGGYFVHIMIDDKDEERPVTIGMTYGTETEIIDGLSEGETITS